MSEEQHEQARPIVFTQHARDRCRDCGAAEEDVITAIRSGTREPAQRGLWMFRMNFEFQREWDGTRYAVQPVAPVVDEQPDRFVIITVYTFYF